MEKGDLRVDVNVSVHEMDPRDNKTAERELRSQRVEIKNLNSFASVECAIRYEADRLSEMLQDHLDTGGGTTDVPRHLTVDETRTFDAHKGQTSLMRRKDAAEDYRFFPEPDLPPLVVTEGRIQRIRNGMPELLHETAARLVAPPYSLTAYDTSVLLAEDGGVAFFDDVFDAVKLNCVSETHAAKVVVNWICNELLANIRAATDMTLTNSPIDAPRLAELITLVETGDITKLSAKHALRLMMQLAGGRMDGGDVGGLQSVRDFADAHDLLRIKDTDELLRACENMLSHDAAALGMLQKYDAATSKDQGPSKKKKKKAAAKAEGVLFGMAMKATSMRADPADLRSALKAALEGRVTEK